MIDSTHLTPAFLLEKIYEFAGRLKEKTSQDPNFILKGPDKFHYLQYVYTTSVLNEEAYKEIMYLKDPTPIQNIKFNNEDIVFSGCLFSPMESPEVFSRLEEKIKTFIYLDIRKLTGLSFDQYLNRTVYEVEMIDRICLQYRDRLEDAERKEQAKIDKIKPEG